MKSVDDSIFRMTLFFILGVWGPMTVWAVEESKEAPFRPDRVVVADSGGPDGKLEITGTIISITGGEGLTIRTEDGKTRSFPMTAVLELETERAPSHAVGEEAFRHGVETGSAEEIQKALLLFREARRNEEKRSWVLRLLTARVVDCLTLLGDSDRAAEEFFLLCRTDPLTPYLSSVPLPWRNRFTGEIGVDRTTVTAWLTPETNPTGKWNPAGELLAASILLDGPDRKRGIEILRELVGMQNPFPENPDAVEFCRTVSLLAAAQLWRMKLSLHPKPEEVDLWRKALDRFPAAVAAGPTDVVARALEKTGNSAAAEDLDRKIRAAWPAWRFRLNP